MTPEVVGPSEEDETAIRDFLLGKTSEADREHLERRLLAEPAFSEMVSAIEEELIDAYTAGLLFQEDRHWFETRFLVTEERRRRVRFSEALARVRVENLPRTASGQGAKPSPIAPIANWHGWMQVAAAAVAAVSLGMAVWMNQTLRGALAELRAAEARVATSEDLIEAQRRQIEDAEVRARAATTSPPAPSPAPRPVLVAALLPGALRGADSVVPALRVSSATLLVELRLELAEDTNPAYAVSIHDASEVEIFRRGALRASTTSTQVLLPLQVPASYLPQGDYSIRLWGESLGALEEIERYYVRILRN